MNLTDYLDELSERMARHKVIDISRASGISRETVRAVRNYGSRCNPSLQTFQQIVDALYVMEGVHP